MQGLFGIFDCGSTGHVYEENIKETGNKIYQTTCITSGELNEKNQHKLKYFDTFLSYSADRNGYILHVSYQYCLTYWLHDLNQDRVMEMCAHDREYM